MTELVIVALSLWSCLRCMHMGILLRRWRILLKTWLIISDCSMHLRSVKSLFARFLLSDDILGTYFESPGSSDFIFNHLLPISMDSTSSNLLLSLSFFFFIHLGLCLWYSTFKFGCTIMVILNEVLHVICFSVSLFFYKFGSSLNFFICWISFTVLKYPLLPYIYYYC